MAAHKSSRSGGNRPRTIPLGPPGPTVTAAVALVTILALTGCATCREHPIACTAFTVLAAGAVAAGSQHSDSNHSPIGAKRPICSAGAC
jgi:hypothetical protein